MRKTCLFSQGLRAVLMAGMVAAGGAYGSESDLINLMSTSLTSVDTRADWEPSNSLPESDASRRKLEPIEAFGIKFSGQASYKETTLQSVTLWCDEALLAPEAAWRVFTQMSDALRPRIGEGKLIKDVPSFEEAFDPKKQVMLWNDGTELIVLSVDAYPTRAGLSLQRVSRSTWLEEMGADEGKFWDKTLKATGLAAPHASMGQSFTQPQAPKKTPGTKPEAGVSAPLDQAWIESRSASLVITQSVDPATDEPIGTIKLGGVSGTLGETPPFYRLQLKTAKHPILLGEKDTRHRFVRRVVGVHAVSGEVTLVPEIAVSYPRSASLGGFVFRREESEISQIGIVLPEINVPTGDDPAALEWVTSIRIGNHELSAENLAQAMSQPLGADTVLVMPTHPVKSPARARILWLALDAKGSFAITSH